MKSISICIFLFLALATVAHAHGGKKHKKDSATAHTESVAAGTDGDGHDDSDHHHDEGEPDHATTTTASKDFPSIHPLIVHFAIVLIIVAAALQLLNIVLTKKEIDWIVTGILFLGVVSVWLASGKFHPHTEELSDHAQSILDQHDQWADWTKISASVGMLLQFVRFFIWQSKRWAITAVALVLTISAYCVSQAGYYGAQLVHIEGIGPQGKYLELEEHHH